MLAGMGAVLSGVVDFGGFVDGTARALPLAPLGKVQRVGNEKLRLSIDQMKDQLEKDLREGQYFVTVRRPAKSRDGGQR